MPGAPQASTPGAGGASVTVIGAGNIGSHLLPHLGRMDRVARVTVVDRDVFAESNLRSQSISTADVGRSKAAVMARRLRSTNSSLQVVAIHDRLENVPAALLRADIWLTCLDSRAARQVANERAFRLGVRLWIDAGVQSSGLLARVSLYTPGINAPCLECLWSEDDYRDIAESYACDGSPRQEIPTNGISSLGALAAALQALECRAVLASEQPAALAARELVIDAGSHKYFVTKLRRNTQCRFDHVTWQPAPIPAEWRTLADIARAASSGADRSSLQVDGRAFVRAIACPACERRIDLVLVEARASSVSLRCRGCDARIPLGWDALSDTLALNGLSDELGRLSLRAIGMRHGDLIAVRAGGEERHFEVCFTQSALAARSSHHG